MANKEEALYLRNRRPNQVTIKYNGDRFPLEHRGSRKDSIALPKEAKNDPGIARWLRIGQLEELTKDVFMRLGTRQVDVLPNEFLKREVREPRGLGVAMAPAESDITKTPTQIDDGDVRKHIAENVRPKWAGDLMTSEEELEVFGTGDEETQNYPSKHRGSDARRQMGY